MLEIYVAWRIPASHIGRRMEFLNRSEVPPVRAQSLPALQVLQDLADLK
jgi:hypothetical protein